MHRIKIISGHLSASGSAVHRRDVWRSESGAAAASSAEDVVVVHGRRTAIGKAKRGAFKVTLPELCGLKVRMEILENETLVLSHSHFLILYYISQKYCTHTTFTWDEMVIFSLSKV